MPIPPPLRTEEVAALRALFTRSSAATEAERIARWTDLMQRPLRSARPLIDLHDLLLFALAFPRSGADAAFATAGLERVAAVAARLSQRSATQRHALMNSGIAGTFARAAFGIDLVRWMADLPHADLRVDELTGDADRVRRIWMACAAPAEREAVEDARHSTRDRSRFLIGAPDRRGVQRLVALIDAAAPGWPLRQVLWEDLGPTLRIGTGAPGCTRTFARVVHANTACFAPGPWPDDEPARPGPTRKVALTGAARHALLDAARGVLIGHLRETDTATCARAEDVELFDMGDGIRVLLLHLPAGRRTVFDAYVGYVAFANGVPVAYGGAWIFPGKSKIGVNVFPAFRGGPSSLIFTRIIRCYARRFRVGVFEAEDYQLGHHNPDGIRSGAYWFYHRLGFRTTDPELRPVEQEERARIVADRTYRTPHSVLRRLVAKPMRLQLRASRAPVFEPIDLGEAVLRHLASRTGTDRATAVRDCVRRVARLTGATARAHWPAHERAAFEALAPALDRIPDLAAWSAADRRALVPLLRAKGARTEDRYLTLLARHPRLLRAWASVASAR